MIKGISFLFNAPIDLQYPEAMIDDVLQSEFAAGKIKVMKGKDEIGIAGKLSLTDIKAIPKNTVLSLVGDFDETQQAALVAEVEKINARNPRYKTFDFVSG